MRDGHVAMVTGGGSGIGAALCAEIARRWPGRIAVADIDAERAAAVAREVGGISVACDVSQPAEITAAIDRVEATLGPIDLYCSNAGVARFDPGLRDAAGADDLAWAQSWTVNVMAHVHAARALVPRMRARAGGRFLLTVSAAGLLSQIGGAAYATSKHAAIGFAECLAIAHHDDGIRVSALCPQAVDTPMLRSLAPGPQGLDGTLTAEEVASCALDGILAERFLILPHATVAGYMAKKSADYDAWIAGMIRLRRRMEDATAVTTRC